MPSLEEYPIFLKVSVKVLFVCEITNKNRVSDKFYRVCKHAFVVERRRTDIIVRHI